LEIDKLENENNTDRITIYKRNAGESDKMKENTDNQD
jgi:hypothetical protein